MVDLRADPWDYIAGAGGAAAGRLRELAECSEERQS